MAYIYRITNIVNGKSYIGKTTRSVMARYSEHCNIANNEHTSPLTRPLYAAMRKYGIKNFSIETLEQCADDVASERETYWITKFNSYQTGYNATLGGEGHKHIDYDAVLDVYAATGNELTTATILHIRTATVREILRATQTTITPAKSILRQAYGKRTNMLDTNFNIIKSFSSIGEAATYISKTTNKKYETVKGHIARARNNPSSISYGYHWSTSE